MAAAPPIIRLGIIGLGGATKQMLPSLAAHPQVRLVAAADPRPEARQKFASDFSAAGFESAEALCGSKEIDAVYIASPHQFHRDHVVMAASAGKHVVVEKPMALSLEDCDAMIAAAESNRVHLVVGHTHSFNPPIRRMREIIRSGELGQVAMINTWYYGNFLFRPRRPEELDTALGGGIIYNQVPHQVDVVRLLGGGMVQSVRSQAWMLDPERPTEGSHLTFLQFADGAAASLVFSGYDFFDTDEWHSWVGESGEEKEPNRHGTARAALRKIASPEAEAKLKAAGGYGNAGGATFPGSDKPWHHPHSGITVVSCERGDMRSTADGIMVYGRDGARQIEVPRGRAYPDKGGVIDELYESFTTGRPPLHDGRWGKATMEVAVAVLRSSKERREITLEHQVPVRD